ncbi:MAG TPA: malic enzyme-like NAD(P)-binding protein [Bacillota bacterium]|nr:malic enzyme-like NAD(P)-binding protein [Bacillota bacterium]
MSLKEQALKLHRDSRGKIEVLSRVPLVDQKDLSLAYTPGVAEPCREIHRERDLVNTYTSRGNMVAVVSDGTAVLGLGDIGPEAAMPVMEGKCILFKYFAGVDAFPICVATKEPKEIVNLVKLLEPTFAGVNLEDISAPRCFEIEDQLKRETEMAIFHDDQHGTAIVVAGALISALKVIGKGFSEVSMVITGAGASSIATAKLLLDMGAGEIILTDRVGPIWQGRTEGMNWAKEEMARRTNSRRVKTLEDAFRGTNVFIGLSGPGVVTREMVSSMTRDAIVLAMANPIPEIFPDDARAAGARVIGTGRSDFPNQVNNVLAFPGVLRGALDCRARDINEPMKQAAARAIAAVISDSELNEGYIIPRALDRRVAPAVAAAVARAAMDSGVARIKVNPSQVAEECARQVERLSGQGKAG